MIEMLGALIPTYLLSKFFLFLLRNKALADTNKILFSNLLSWIICSILYAYGSANGGEPKFIIGFITYSIPQLIWTVFYLVKLNKKQ